MSTRLKSQAEKNDRAREQTARPTRAQRSQIKTAQEDTIHLGVMMSEQTPYNTGHVLILDVEWQELQRTWLRKNTGRDKALDLVTRQTNPKITKLRKFMSDVEGQAVDGPYHLFFSVQNANRNTPRGSLNTRGIHHRQTMSCATTPCGAGMLLPGQHERSSRQLLSNLFPLFHARCRIHKVFNLSVLRPSRCRYSA